METAQNLKSEILECVSIVKAASSKLSGELGQVESGSGNINGDKVAVSLLALRAANRDANLKVEQLKRMASETRESIAGPKMKLENLIYLAEQLKNEIHACRSYEGTFGKLELLTEEEVFKADEASSKSEHDRMLGRLDAELNERKRLQTKVAELVSKKRRLEVENSSLSKFLDDLPEKVEGIVVASKPVRDYFLSSRVGKSTIAKMNSFSKAEVESINQLPTPLYIVYREAAGFRDAFEEGMSVSIVQEKSGSESDLGPDGSIVRLCFREAADSSKQMETFLRFHSELGIVSLQCKSTTLDAYSMCLLYPGDDGLESPNPQNTHALESNQDIRTVCRGGLPFMFAQLICGLRFPDRVVKGRQKKEVGDPAEWTRAAVSVPLHARFGAVIAAMRARARTVRSLASQLESLAKGSCPLTASASDLPAEPRSRMTPWKKIRKACTNLTKVYNFEIMSDRFVVFTVEVTIRIDYPHRHPEWQISTSENVPSVEDIQDLRLVLDQFMEDYMKTADNPEMLLSVCVKRLQACVDVIAETEGTVSRTPASRLVGRPRWEQTFHSRLRQRPLAFDKKKQVFEQASVPTVTEKRMKKELKKKQPKPSADPSPPERPPPAKSRKEDFHDEETELAVEQMDM